MHSAYYHPSGQVPARGVYLVLLVAVASIPLARLYGWASFHANVTLAGCVAIAMALILGLIGRHTATYARIRHPAWMRRAGVAIALFVWYIHWAAWLGYAGHDGESWVYLATHPLSMLALAARRLTDYSSSTASFVLSCWLTELGMLVLACAMAAAARARQPFCETTGQWAEKVNVEVRFASIADPEAVRRSLEHDPLQLAAVLVPCASGTREFAELALYRCRGGDSFITLTNYVEAAPGSEARRQAADTLSMRPEKLEVVFQSDEPVVELLRLPIPDTDPLLRKWEEDALVLEACAI